MTTEAVQSAGPIARRPHVPGTSTQVVGLALLALAPLTMFTIGVATGTAGTEVLVFGTIGIVLATTAWLAGRSGTRTAVLGIVVTVLAALAGFWIAFGLAAIASPADFVPATMFVLGLALSLTGGIQVVTRRRQPPVTGPTRGERRVRVVAFALVVLAAAMSLAANLAGRSSVAADLAAGATPVAMGAMEFTATRVTVEADDDAALLVSNSDAFLHDLAIPDQDLAVTVNPGSQALLDVSSLPAGTYTFYCTLHSDTSDPDPATAGMAATLVVR